jgi:hypothetical protein
MNDDFPVHRLCLISYYPNFNLVPCPIMVSIYVLWRVDYVYTDREVKVWHRKSGYREVKVQDYNANDTFKTENWIIFLTNFPHSKALPYFILLERDCVIFFMHNPKMTVSFVKCYNFIYSFHQSLFWSIFHLSCWTSMLQFFPRPDVDSTHKYMRTSGIFDVCFMNEYEHTTFLASFFVNFLYGIISVYSISPDTD